MFGAQEEKQIGFLSGGPGFGLSVPLFHCFSHSAGRLRLRKSQQAPAHQIQIGQH
jgi:hypothetical protein